MASIMNRFLDRERSISSFASQAFTVLLCVVALLIDSFVLIVAAVFAVIALILISGERPSRGSGPS